MIDPRVQLRNPIIAGILAYLVPGLGHLYQRRYFKAAVYFFCIMGIFTWGCSLGEAKAVHLRWDTSDRVSPKTRTLGFLAQMGIGLVAIPTYFQFDRYEHQLALEYATQQEGSLQELVDSDFEGLYFLLQGNQHGSVKGRIQGKVVCGQYGSGSEFIGTLDGKSTDGSDLKLTVMGSRLAGSLDLGRRVTGLDEVTPREMKVEQRPTPNYSGSRRRFFARIVDEQSRVQDLGLIEGTISRPVTNHLFAPLSDDAMQHLHGRLGKYYELALVYTWIAGLLNVLAVWDALQGPAYGYGDEKPDESEEKPKAGEPVPAVASVSKTEPLDLKP